MCDTLDIQKYIQHFQTNMRPADRRGDGTIPQSQPNYPQLVIYLGEGAVNAHETLSGALLQVWPQFRKELKFVSAKRGLKGLNYAILPCDGTTPTSITATELEELGSGLFDITLHFANRNNLLVYYVLDSAELTGKEDFLHWAQDISTLKQSLGIRANDIVDMLTLLLDEKNNERRRVSYEVRNCLSSFGGRDGNPVRQSVDNVLLMSNRCQNNAMLGSWDLCYKALASVIALSNNSDSVAAKVLSSHSVLTVRYARQEKPVREIAQVVTDALLRILSDQVRPVSSQKILEDPDLKEKLGLTGDGTFEILDLYAQQNLYQTLPNAQQLEYFPRKDTNDQYPMEQMSAKDFDDYTMGAWKQYLNCLAEGTLGKMNVSNAVRLTWAGSYAKHLRSRFTKEELISLADHFDRVKAIVSMVRRPLEDLPVLDAAQHQLRYMLSTNAHVVDILLGVLKEEGETASSFRDSWNSLLISRQNLHAVNDPSIITYYGRIVQDYFDHNDKRLLSDFGRAQSVETLNKLLCRCLDEILSSDPVFLKPFDQELKVRQDRIAQNTESRSYILDKLTGNDAYTYLQTISNLGAPLISSILMKTGTELHRNIDSLLEERPYYYNTGNINAAESLVLYEVSAYNLVHKEAE